MRKILFLIVVIFWSPLQAETPQGQIHILGDIDESTKQLFIQTITDELHGFTHQVSLQTESSLYADQPLSSLNAIREIIGIDGSLKYLSWNSYSELPPEKIYLASKVIAQDYLFLHF